MFKRTKGANGPKMAILRRRMLQLAPRRAVMDYASRLPTVIAPWLQLLRRQEMEAESSQTDRPGS